MTKQCVKCRFNKIESKNPNVYHYKISGLENVYLEGGVTEYICPKCGAKSTSIKNMGQLHKVIANNLVIAKRRLVGKELRFLRELLGYSAKELAEVLDYNEDHVRKIETEIHPPKAPYEMFLRVAVMREMKAPEYDLRELTERKSYKLEELHVVSNKNGWEVQSSAA